MTDREREEIEQLTGLLKAGTSAPLAVEAAVGKLKDAGFEELEFFRAWGLSRGGKYYMKHHDTTLIAFTVGDQLLYRESFRMAAAHTDYPCLRVKPRPDIRVAAYDQLNVEVYGGPIINTWLDRPLGLSGRVAVKSEDVMRPDIRFLNVERPFAIIPNLAVHLNREVNKGIELNRQTQLKPIIGVGQESGEEKEVFLQFLTRELSVAKEDILDYELWLTCLQEPQTVGLAEELFVSPRLDNLTSVQALLTGLIRGSRREGVNLIALFDHEEVGSQSKQGAASLLLFHVLEKICASFGQNSIQTREQIYDSMLISADVAQGTHPNYMEKVDPTNQPVLNGGFCIKEACAQSYATDCEAIAIVEQICRKMGISYQKFVNRSDQPGGRTLGTIASGLVPVPTVDIGVPILAMHSAVETMGVKDLIGMTDFITAYFST